MKATLVSKEANEVKFDVVFSSEEFEAACEKVYKRERGSIQIDGFRKGKAPRKIIENYYGADIFWSEALNDLLENGYGAALDELEIEPIEQPVPSVKDIKKGEDVVVSFTVKVFPEMDIENYKGLEIEESVTKIGAKEVKAELERIQKKQARMETVTDRTAKNGDTVIIDFVGSIDGVEFEGGKGENFELKLGSGQFIPGFEDQLVGKNADEQVDVEVTFPEDYHAEDLAGKPALFKVTVHEIKEEILPEIDDEFASDVSEFETLAEYKKDLKKSLQAAADNTDESIMKDRTLEALFNANPIEAPESMIQNELDNMVAEMDQQLGYQGISVKDYLQWMGKTVEELKEESRTDAVKRVNTRIILKNIARMENIEVTEDEMNAELETFGAQMGATVEQVKEMIGSSMKYFVEDIQTKKAIDMIYGAAVKVAAKEEKKDEE
ncbi:MAG: trigger factor [Clostridiales bacterium]|nr:trigger factor [Candidatus Crickella merdequi]